MAEMPLEKAPKKVRDLCHKGMTSLERGNFDYAIDLLMRCVEMCPELLQARKMLRAAEIQKLKKKKVSSMTHQISSVTGLPAYLKVKALIKQGKAAEAVLAGEKLLKIDVLNFSFIKAFAEAAVLAKLPEAAIQALEVARDYYPDDIVVLNWLGMQYQKVGRMKSARECFEKLCEISPNDPAALKMLKDSMALDSMNSDGWESTAKSGGSFRDMVKDSDEAKRLEQEQKAVKSDDDADNLIADTLKKIEDEPGNINYYRALARLYSQKNDFDNAVAALTKAQELAPGDPELDATFSRLRKDQYDWEIKQLREAGDEETAQAKELEKAQYVFDDLQERVKRYPNDLDLRYQLAVVLYDNDYIDESIQQLQRAQRSPKHRVKALYYLALCFRSKKQYDLAMEQLKKAASEQYSMDETKKNILYEMGTIAEAMGNAKQAAEYYKEIYSVDISYRDVSDKVQQLYSSAEEG